MRLAMLLLFAACTQAAQPPASLTAAQILARVPGAYADATSYTDHGTATASFQRDGAVTHTKKIDFTTAFVRPDRFRFEYRRDKYEQYFGNGVDSRAYTIWTHQGRAFSRWYGQPDIVHEWHLLDAIAAATGVSQGTASFVPLMLLREASHATALTAPRLEGVEPVDAHPCWRIAGGAPDGAGSMTLWIDQTSFLVRKVIEREHLDGAGAPFDVVQTTVYTPATNAPVPPALLAAPETTGTTLTRVPPRRIIGVTLAAGSTRVTRLAPDGPAARAGVLLGDELVSFGGETVADVNNLAALVQRRAAGASVDVVVRRGGQLLTLAVTVATR